MSETALYRVSLNYVKQMAPGPVEFDMRNGREHPPGGWQDCGFELKQHESRVQDWSNEAEITEIHYQEISDFAKELTGADHALVGGHILRNPEQMKIHQQLGPIMFAHSDFAETYGDLIRARYTDDLEGLEGLKRAGVSPDAVTNAKRMLILQFWRNVGEPRMDLPLAFCDARTARKTDVRAFPVNNYADSGFNFDALAMMAPENSEDHHWYAFPEMQKDEVVAFRTYDTDRVGTDLPFWTPHCAFRDPDVELGQPSRYSIELRATCIWE
ncbi:MAG: hypothetical protein MKZ98_07870 [Pseudomonadales bacterium]|nr:hypothetical protein [Pseudomonadales bacterium]